MRRSKVIEGLNLNIGSGEDNRSWSVTYQTYKGECVK